MIRSSLLERVAEKLLVAIGTPLDWLLVLAGRMFWKYVVIIVSAWVLVFLSKAW